MQLPLRYRTRMHREGWWFMRNGRLAAVGAATFCAILAFSVAAAGGTISVPVRWCGVQGAPSMANPGNVNELTTDDVMWRRHERPSDKLYIPFVDMTFRAGATAAIKNGPLSFPIVLDPVGGTGDLEGSENTDIVGLCRRAWLMGDPLYFDTNDDGVVDEGTDTLLSTDIPLLGKVELGHDGAPLRPAPSDVRFVDSNGDSAFTIGERIYRDENGNATVDAADTLLVETLGTIVGAINAADLGAALLPVPSEVKYVDLIREPPGTFNIGYPAVHGITAVSAGDVEYNSIAFPVHGVASAGIGGLGVVMDDPSQYLPPGPDYTLFEIQLVAHEFGHGFGLLHGDGIDDDANGVLDDADDPPAPVPGAGPGTLCDSNNVMSYCWLDNGTSGNPNLAFIGVPPPTYGSFTPAQSLVIRNTALTQIPDRIVDPVTPRLVAARADTIGDVDETMAHLDITDFTVDIDSLRQEVSFALATRRPLPSDLESDMEVHFLIDVDGNPETGSRASVLQERGIPTDFEGAEIAGSLQVRGGEIVRATLARWISDDEGFRLVDHPSIRGVRETVTAIADFPIGRRGVDGLTAVVEAQFPVQDAFRLVAPNGLVPVATGTRFSVEFVTVDVRSGVADRARTPGMHFEPPVFPRCSVAPDPVRIGDTAQVFASGLLADREVHLFLGDTFIGNGATDGFGGVTMTLPVPDGTPTGPRLVTVGAAAVSADCVATVAAETTPELAIPGETDTTRVQLWVVIALLIVLLILVAACCCLRRR